MIYYAVVKINLSIGNEGNERQKASCVIDLLDRMIDD